MLRAAIVAAGAALLVALGGTIAAAPASASTPGVELSSDGVHYSATYSGSLFPSAALLVPQSTQTGEFWVRNGSSEPAYLRVSISDLTGGGTTFSAALTVSAAPAGGVGAPAGVDSAAPCYVLTQGRVLAPGASVKVVAKLSMADLAGTAGQQSTVGFDLLVGLSDAAYGSMPPTTCPSQGGIVPGPTGGGGSGGTGGTGGSGGSGGSGTSAAPGGPGGSGGTTGAGGTGTPSGPVSGAASGGHAASDTPAGSAFAGLSVAILDGNTGRLYQEWFVILWILGVLAGGAARAVWARVREHGYEYEYGYEYGDVGLEEVDPWLVGARSSASGVFSTT